MLTDPKAQKRFDNDKIRAEQGAMLTPAAKLSLRPEPQRVERGNRVAQLVQGLPTNQAPTQFPSNRGGLSEVPQNTNGMSISNLGSANGNDIEQTLKNDLDLDKFLGSSELQQSLARSKLRQYFMRNSPSGTNFDIATDALNNLLQNQ